MVRRGMSMIEVMVALVILGVVITIFFQTSKYSTRNQGKTRSWTAEAAVLEKTVEGLRSDSSMTTLQSMNASWIDSSQGGAKIQVTVVGSLPPSTVATTFPANMLAQLQITVKKLTESDSLCVTTVLWVN